MKKLIFIIILGLLLRVLWLSFSSHVQKFDWSRADINEHDFISAQAHDLTKGIFFYNTEGKPSMRRPIGYPIFLSVFYKLFGANKFTVNTVDLILYVLLTILIFLIGESLFSRSVGLWSAAILALYPTSIYSISLITDEHLFVPLWFLGLYLLLRKINA